MLGVAIFDLTTVDGKTSSVTIGRCDFINPKQKKKTKNRVEKPDLPFISPRYVINNDYRTSITTPRDECILNYNRFVCLRVV